MAQSFEFQAKFGADLSEFNRELNEAAGDVTKLAQVFKKFQADASDPIKTEVFVQLDGRDAISGKVQVVSDKFQGLDKDVRSLVTQLNKLNGAEKGSVTSIKQQISAVQQAINATKRGTENYKKLTTSLKGLRAEYNKAAGIQKGSVAALKQQAIELERLANSYRIGSIEQRKFQRELDRVNSSITGAAGPFSKLFGALENVAKFQAGFVAVSAAIQSITGSLNQFIGQAKQLEGFELALKNIGFSTAETARALADAKDIAKGLGAPLDQVENSFKRMVPALQAVGTNAEDTNKFIESISARTQTLGLNTEQSGRFLEAFAQVLSKGKLQSEELNQQISELDGAFRTQLADALDVTTEELEDLIKTGQVTAPVFVKAVNDMENGAAALRKRVSEGNLTIQQLQNNIRTLNIENLRTIGAALEPAIKAFFEIQEVFAQFVADISQTEFGQFLVEAINGVVIGIRNFVIGFTEAAKAVIQFLSPVFALLRTLNNVLQPFGGIVGVLTTYVTTLVAATAAQNAYNVALLLSQKTWSGLPQIIKLNTKVLQKFGAVLKGLAAIDLASSFGKGTKAIVGKTKATYGAVGAMDDLQGLANQMLPRSMGGLGKSYAAAGTAAKGAGAATAGLSLATVAAGAAAGLAAGAVAILYANYQYAAKEAADLEASTRALKEMLEEQGTDVQEQTGFWENLGKGFQKIGRDIARFFGAEKSLIEGGIRGYQNYKGVVAQAFMSVHELGLNIYDLESIQNSTNEALTRGVEVQKAVVKAGEDEIKMLKKKIKQHKEEENFDYVAILEEQLKQVEEALPLERQQLKLLQKEVAQRKAVARAAGEQIESLEDLNESMKMQNQVIENSKIEELTNNLKMYGKTSNDASKLAVANLATEAMAREKQIELIEDEIKKAQELYDQNKLTEKQMEEHAGKQLERQGKILELNRQRAESSNQLSEILINNFEKELNKSGEVAQSYLQISQSIQQASDSATGAVTATLGSISQAVDLVAQREVNLLEEGDKKRRQIIAAQLASQINISRLETAIGIAKTKVATSIAITELRVMQQRLRGEAAIARLRGDEKGAAVLEEQARNINNVVALKKIEERITIRNAQLQQRIREEQILQKGVQEKIAGDYDDQKKQLFETEKLLGVNRLHFNEISNAASATRDDLAAIENLSGDISKNNRAAAQSARRGPEEAAKATKELAKAYDGANAGAAKLWSTMREINKTAAALVGNLSSARSLLDGTSARWMGGPVEAGQTYRVNDAGLGREAFMNKFGDIKMLPAGSNINWTAPSSGQIIPAAIVSQMRKNAELNSSISFSKQQDKPIVSGVANAAQGGSSGNLVKQIQSALSGSNSNQRITNNVTIQSQQPVTDASEIMANVARMRLRGSRRI